MKPQLRDRDKIVIDRWRFERQIVNFLKRHGMSEYQNPNKEELQELDEIVDEIMLDFDMSIEDMLYDFVEAESPKVR